MLPSICFFKIIYLYKYFSLKFAITSISDFNGLQIAFNLVWFYYIPQARARAIGIIICRHG